MNTIIAATNFSEGSNHAVEFATGMARVLKAQLVIFNVIGLVPAMSDVQLPLNVCDVTIEETDKLLEDLALRAKTGANNEIEVKTLYKVGSVIKELDALCQREAPFALVIASRFVTAFERLILGTYSVSIAKYSAFPVLVVPPSATMNGFKKVAIAVDLDAENTIQWQFLKHWLAPFDPQVDIVYISAQTEGTGKEPPAAIDFGEQLGNDNLEYYFLKNNNVAEGIKDYIVEKKPELLVMSVQKHGLFHKSITKPFIERPPVPVLFLSSKLKEDGRPLAAGRSATPPSVLTGYPGY